MSAVKKVVIYCRESRDDGYANYGRIETQRDILLDYSARMNLGDVVKVIMDDNVSGANFSRLDIVKKMAIEKEMDILLCKDASRIGRNLLDSLKFTEFLSLHGIQLIFESEAYEEDIFPIIAWFNERRAKEDSSKIRRVLRHKMEQGAMVVKAPYGYKKEGNTLVINENEAATVREIFELYVQGYAINKIMAILNERRCPTPSVASTQNYPIVSKGWNRQHIHRILKRVVYTGAMPYGMFAKASYKSKEIRQNNPDNWIIVENHHAPIISEEIFMSAQKKLKQSAETVKSVEHSGNLWSNEKKRALFSGFIVCGGCGSKLYPRTIAGKRVYICHKYNNEGKRQEDISRGKGCSMHRIDEETLLRHTRIYLHQLLSQVEIKEILKTINNNYDADKENLIRKRHILYKDRMSNIIHDDLYLQKEKEIKDQIKKLENISIKKRKIIPDDTFLWQLVDFIINEGLINVFIYKIIVFEPEEISRSHMSLLKEAVYRQIWEKGGIVFLKNYGE